MNQATADISAVEKTAEAICDALSTFRWSQRSDDERDRFRKAARAAIKVALSDPVYAAAPAMLEALQDIVELEWRGGVDDLLKVIKNARAAVALATEDSKP